jgi:hypothetical protein
MLLIPIPDQYIPLLRLQRITLLLIKLQYLEPRILLSLQIMEIFTLQRGAKFLSQEKTGKPTR